jgi:hypothetical protein
MNLPVPSDGDWKKYRKFIQSVVLYLGVNRHTHYDNESKIGFLLFYLDDKEPGQL